MKIGDELKFEGTEEIFILKAMSDRYLIGVRDYTMEERRKEISKWDREFDDILKEEYEIQKDEYFDFDEFCDDSKEYFDLLNEYRYENGDQPEPLSEDTFCYTIIDLKEKERGGDNYYCKFDYSDENECKKAIKELESGDVEISRRNKIELRFKL